MKFNNNTYQETKQVIDKIYSSLEHKPNFILKIWETQADRADGNATDYSFDPQASFIEQIEEIEATSQNYAATEVWWQTSDGEFLVLWSDKIFDDGDQFDFDYETVKKLTNQ